MRVYIFCVICLLLTSCESLKEFQNSFSSELTTPKNSRPSVKDPKWFLGPEYREKIASISKVESWAYQKLASEAIEANDIEKLKLYLNKGVNPNMGTERIDKISLLERAINKTCYDCINAMKGKASFNFSAHGYYRLPIVLAALHSNEMLNFLMVNFDINPNCYGKGGQMVTALAALTSIDTRRYKKNNREDVIRYMLNAGAKPMYGSAFPFYHYFDHIEEATPETIRLFAEKGTDFNWKYTGYGTTTILGYAIEKKRYDIAEVLLEAGASPNYCNGYNSVLAPMHWAIKHNSIEMVKLLVENGANVNCRNYINCKPGGSALDYALNQKKDQAIIDYLIAKGAK